MVHTVLRTLALGVVISLALGTAALAFGGVNLPNLTWPECGAFDKDAKCETPAPQEGASK